MFYYKVLGCKKNATSEEIHKQYKKMSLQWHPDRNRDNPEKAAEMFKIISEAYQTLIDPISRTNYDNNLKQTNNNIADPFALFNRLFKKQQRQAPKNRTKNRNSSNNINQSQSMSMQQFKPMNIFDSLISGSMFSDSMFSSNLFDNDPFFNNSGTSMYSSSTTVYNNGVSSSTGVKRYTKNGKQYVEKYNSNTDKNGVKKVNRKNYVKDLK